MYIESFKEFIVWQKGIKLVKEIYRASNDLPNSELYGLISQMRRSAVSIPANIAEGKKRKTKKDFLMFLRMASGSAAELDTLITIAVDIYPSINFSNCSSTLLEIQKMLTTMIKKLEASTS